jgi:hypothetical protein
MQVVFLVRVASDDPETIAAAVRKMVKRSPGLTINGMECLKWAIHLCEVCGCAPWLVVVLAIVA